MPVLHAEAFSFPSNPFAGSSIPDGSDVDFRADGAWHVMHTKSRAEKSLSRWLYARSIRFFLPVYKKQVRQNGRDYASHLPLFPGYLFVWGNHEARYAALTSNQVARCLPVPDQDELVADLLGVYRLMVGDFPLAPVLQMPPGTPVEVVDGPFAGLTGTILRAGSNTRLFVEIRMIKQGVSVELNCSAVRPLTENGEAQRARLALLRR